MIFPLNEANSGSRVMNGSHWNIQICKTYQIYQDLLIKTVFQKQDKNKKTKWLSLKYATFQRRKERLKQYTKLRSKTNFISI